MSIFTNKKKSIPEDAVPATVEQAIPLQDIYEDGICLVGRNLYSKTYRFTDINYATASREDKEGMFLAYSQILNSFDTQADTKITINNRRMNRQKFEQHSLLELQGDMLDRYRAEYNHILTENVGQSNGIMQDKYLTVTIEKGSPEEARSYFSRVGAEFSSLFASLGSRIEKVDREEKLRIFFDFFHYGSEEDFHFDASLYDRRGYSFKDTVLPYGAPKLTMRRTLTTESLAVFMPFRVQEVCHNDGIYFANNAISKNMIMINRNELLNGNSFITGVSGSGKSLLAKQEVINLFLADKNADIIIIDPEKEYGKICDAFGGETIEISATSSHHINAMDINMDYADGQNPVTLKSEFMLSLCEQAVAGLGPKQKSLIDRCTANVLNDYMLRGFTGNAPTLKDFNAMLKAQPEPEAKDIALSLELFTSGSLDTFAGETNVDTENRLICYDIHDLGKQLMPIGMLVVLDNILNRITANKAKGRKTYIFIDEIYLLFKHEYSANFLFTLWKRVRKYGAFITGITQNVEDLLQSHTARTMLANSELVVMLNQAATDRAELADLMGISDLQMSYITGVEAGHGLVKIGSALVPFVNRVPKDTMLFQLMNTKPGEA